MRKGGLTVATGHGGYDYDYAYDFMPHDNFCSFEIAEEEEQEDCGDVIFGDAEINAMLYIQMYGFPLLLLQGIVGNLLAIPVLYSISRSAWSTVTYLALLGGVDLIILLVRCGDSWYTATFMVGLGERILGYSDAVCRTYTFAFNCVIHLSPWLIVATSVEMMIATRWPKRTYFMCTREKARYAFMLMLIIIVCLDINYFWTYGVPKPGCGCRYTEEFSTSFRDVIWPAMSNMVELVLPLATVSTCFFLTAATMIRRPASQERDLESEMKRYFLELATLRDFRTICLILCLMFICLTTFKITFNLTSFLFNRGYLEMECETKIKFSIHLELFRVLDMTLSFLFASTKIYLYVALSSVFRTKLGRGFVCVFRKIGSCCRAGSTCGRRWAPVSLQDCGDAEHRGQCRPLVHDETANSLSKAGIQEEREVTDTSKVAPENTDLKSKMEDTEHSSKPQGAGNSLQGQVVKASMPDHGVMDKSQRQGVKDSVSDHKVRDNIQKHGVRVSVPEKIRENNQRDEVRANGPSQSATNTMSEQAAKKNTDLPPPIEMGTHV